MGASSARTPSWNVPRRLERPWLTSRVSRGVLKLSLTRRRLSCRRLDLRLPATSASRRSSITPARRASGTRSTVSSRPRVLPQKLLLMLTLPFPLLTQLLLLQWLYFCNDSTLLFLCIHPHIKYI